MARFKLLDRVEARYKDPNHRGGTWSRSSTSRPSSTCSRRRRRSGRTRTCCVGTTARRTSSCSRTTYARRRRLAAAQEARAAVEEGRAAAQEGRRRAGAGRRRPAPSRRRRRRRGPAPRRTTRKPWTPEEEQHLQELVDEHGGQRGDWSWPTIAEELGTGRTKEAVEEHYNNMLERRRIPAAAAAGDDQAQKLRINASGRIATLVQKKQRGWLVVKLDENEGEDGAPHEQRSIRTNFVTLLGRVAGATSSPPRRSAGGRRPPLAQRRRRRRRRRRGRGPANDGPRTLQRATASPS